MEKPGPPKFLDHHVPTPGYALVPDCLCPECSAIRKAWGDAREADGQARAPAPDVVIGVDPGHRDKTAVVFGHKTAGGALVVDKVRVWEPAEATARPPLGPALVWRDVTCPGCRRFFCKVLTLPDVRLIPHCEGCALEGR